MGLPIFFRESLSINNRSMPMLVVLALTATLLVRPCFSTTFRHDSPEAASLLQLTTYDVT